MIAPSELVSLAVRGTTQQATQGDHQSASNILRQFGVHSFQQQGGYIPCFDDKSLNMGHTSATVSYVQQRDLRYLHIILAQHPQMLEEWVQSVCETGQAIPDEYIPYFLDMGSQHTHLQKLFKLIMSDRVAWLLSQHKPDRWDWYDKCEVPSFDNVMQDQTRINRVTAYKICVSLSSETLYTHNHRGLMLLRNFTSMWTVQIAGLLLEVMFISNMTASYDDKSLLVEIIRKAGYHLPLAFVGEFLAELRTGVEDWHRVADELAIIFAMRREMLASIQESAR